MGLGGMGRLEKILGAAGLVVILGAAAAMLLGRGHQAVAPAQPPVIADPADTPPRIAAAAPRQARLASTPPSVAEPPAAAEPAVQLAEDQAQIAEDAAAVGMTSRSEETRPGGSD